MTSGIYEIRNKITGDRYIGQSIDIAARWRMHESKLRRCVAKQPHLQNAWNKYGAAAFEFRVLGVCAPRDLTFFEQTWMDALKPEYNVAPAAGSPRGFKHPPEFGFAISARQRGKKHGPMPVQQREALSRALTGRSLTAAHRAAVAIGMTGVKRGPHSPERKAQISAQLRGRTLTPEHRANVSRGQTGKKKRPHTAETKLKISQALAGKTQSAEAVEKRASTLRGRPRPARNAQWSNKISTGKRGKPWSVAQRAAHDRKYTTREAA